MTDISARIKSCSP